MKPGLYSNCFLVRKEVSLMKGKAYSVIITLVALGLLIYIVAGHMRPVTSDTAGSSVRVAAQADAKATTSLVSLFSHSTATPKPVSIVKTYILNKNTKKFHKPDCYSVKQMNESNKRTYTGTRESIIEMGYAPCQNCHP